MSWSVRSLPLPRHLRCLFFRNVTGVLNGGHCFQCHLTRGYTTTLPPVAALLVSDPREAPRPILKLQQWIRNIYPLTWGGTAAYSEPTQQFSNGEESLVLLTTQSTAQERSKPIERQNVATIRKPLKGTYIHSQTLYHIYKQR